MTAKRNIRGYVRKGSKVVRFLSFTLYGADPCTMNELHRECLYILSSNDKRPKGSHWKGADWCFDWFEKLPVGIWIELITPKIKEAA